MDKTPGPKNVRLELSNYGPNILFQLLTFVFNYFLRGEPPEWKQNISNLYKRRDRKLCSNYRKLIITKSISRLYGRIIEDRIEQQFQDVASISVHHA